MLTNVIRFLTNVTRWIALAVMAFMMFFIAIAVISRLTVTPIIGDVEIVQLGMIVLIMCGLAYTQRVDGHISIGIIVDRFPQKGQLVMDAIGSLLNVVVTLIIAYIYVGVFLNHKNEMQLSTSLLEVPYYPFDFIIILGFTMWGLEALLKCINSVIGIFQPIQK